MMERVYNIGFRTSKPMGFGLCNNGKSCYSLSEWLDGEDAGNAIDLIPETEQYVLGLKAGEVLQKIHTLAPPENTEPWKDFFFSKVRNKIDFYNSTPMKSDKCDIIVRYLQENNHLLEGRPQTFIHGDYNKTNLIVMPDGQIGVIDFSALNKGHGDPWWDFDPTNWGNEPNAYYCTGLIKGYFNYEPPNDFFDMFSYYLAYDALAAICNTSVGNQGEPEEGLQHLDNILRWYNNMQSNVPSWYISEYEVWDVLDADGNKTGRYHERGKPMASGDYHLVVHVWKHNGKGEWLINRRALNRGTSIDGYWETTGGAALVGDDSLTAALREAKEELGLMLDPKKGTLFHRIPRHGDDGRTWFQDAWVFEHDCPIEDVQYQKSETCDAMWASADKIREMIASGDFLSDWFYPYLEAMFTLYER
jgi:8-oxo-dGTP pyrophosphatase MutT (NUDIX family)